MPGAAMAELNEQGLNLLRLLEQRLDSVDPSLRSISGLIPYGEALAVLGLPNTERTAGASLLRYGLQNLAEWTKVSRLPAITGIIIDRTTSRPGGDYFRLFDRRPDDYIWWQQQLLESKHFNWRPFILEAPPTPSAADVDDPPPRVMASVLRIVRDTKVVRLVKELHGYECQACSTKLRLPDGRFYAEGHHLQPLGRGGPDIATNVLCLCPTCHVAFDYGIREWALKDLRQVRGHSIGAKYLSYHNETIVVEAHKGRKCNTCA